jgi:hypothetical protein
MRDRGEDEAVEAKVEGSEDRASTVQRLAVLL